ncbi:type I-E CRISPR-associated protein Cas5/CasD [Streptomyces zhihengii]|uniref:type I-E CRISPR-associated protein Cas5/CasD n=1 Tax=Streptomyces zhihengii TaxID=1818004 RepID=UPI0033A9F7CB
MTGFLLQVGGPLQAWGEHSSFTDRDTLSHPTRSGLLGMMAAALGITRHDATLSGGKAGAPASFDELSRLRFTVRHDRPGSRLRDFHTVGGGLPANRTAPTAKGGRRPPGAGTIVTERHYVTDAVFTVAVTAPGAPNGSRLLGTCAHALEAPRWPLHLGRRSCPPGAVLVVATGLVDPVGELVHEVPLARPRAAHGDGGAGPHDAGPAHRGDPAGVPVRFTADAPLPPVVTPRAADVTVGLINDDPVSLRPRDRVYRVRHSYEVTRPLDGNLCAGYGSAYADALLAYRQRLVVGTGRTTSLPRAERGRHGT